MHQALQFALRQLPSYCKLFLFCVFVLVCRTSASADPFGIEENPIAKHVQQPSSVKFSSTKIGLAAKPNPDINDAMEFRSSAVELPPGAGTYDGKPNCAKSDVKRAVVKIDQPMLDFYDLLFYNYHDAEQVRRAAAWELPAAPYLEGHPYNPYRDESNYQQNVARLFKITCLPTRMHFVTINGVRYKEFREGAAAWDTQQQ